MRNIFLFFLFFIKVTLFSQFYSSGQDPWRINWRQINTVHYQIVFSEEITEEAKRLANILEYIYEKTGNTLNHKPSKISVLLHNHTTLSNGFVAWAPKRIEASSIPPQDIYPQYWLEQLAIHETRHVVQIDKLKQGISSILYMLAGEQAVGAVSGYIPMWVYEGDAVVTETALSHSGRGRMPSFEMKMKAMLLDKQGMYPYQKATFGSYRDYVPSYYHYGYYITSYARKEFGAEVWGKTIDYVGQNPYAIVPTYFGIKKHTGLSKTELYRDAMDNIRSRWEKEEKKNDCKQLPTWNIREKGEYVSYRFPQWIADSLIIAEKDGIDQIKEFVILDQMGREKKVFTPGFYSSVRLSYANDKIVWGEYIPHIRWSNKNYYVIKYFDIKRKKEVCLTKNTRYFAPAINHEGTKIAAVAISIKNEYALVIIDAGTGNILKRFNTPCNHFIQIPSWAGKEEKIYVTFIDEGGKGIYEVDIHNETWKEVLAPSNIDISHPVCKNHYLFYRAGYIGKDDIYALDLLTEKIYRVTNTKYGAYDPAISYNGKRIVYSRYSASGYDIVSELIDTTKWRQVHLFKDTAYAFYKTMKAQEKDVVESEKIPEDDYEIRPYRRSTHLFNVHSWLPAYFDYTNPDLKDPSVYPGIMFLSQNILSTANAATGIYYKPGSLCYNANFSYKGWFPVFDVSFNYGGEPTVIPEYYSYLIPDIKEHFDIASRVYMPLNFTKNKMIRGLRPLISHTYDNYYLFSNDLSTYYHGRNILQYEMLFYNYLKMSKRDIVPSFGQVARFDYGHTPFKPAINAEMITPQFTLYFPGFSAHHSFKLHAGLQKNFTDNMLSGPLLLSRGFQHKTSKDFYRVYLDYIMPFGYPDYTIGSYFYLKRFRGALFIDYTHAYNDAFSNSLNGTQTSVGVDMIGDFHIFQFLFPLSAGIRCMYLPNQARYRAELIFDVDLNNF